MEEMVWHPLTGALLTHAPSTYKIPTANDTPAHFKVAFLGCQLLPMAPPRLDDSTRALD